MTSAVPVVTMLMRDSRLLGVDLGYRQALDVVAAAGEQADDAGQDARLVVDQDGDRVLFDGGFHGTGLQMGSDGDR